MTLAGDLATLIREKSTACKRVSPPATTAQVAGSTGILVPSAASGCWQPSVVRIGTPEG